MSNVEQYISKIKNHEKSFTSDYAAWKNNPKHQWVYDSSAVLNKQNVVWSPVKTENSKSMHRLYTFDQPFEIRDCSKQFEGKTTDGWIFTEIKSQETKTVVAVIQKGKIKWCSFANFNEEPVGTTYLNLSAFALMNLNNYNGIITFIMSENDTILDISLKLNLDCLTKLNNNEDFFKALLRVYNRRNW